MKGQKANVGDTRVAPNGYHYTRTEQGWRLTHHLTMEAQLGRRITPDEMVRFKPGFDKTCYADPNALVIITKGKTSKAKRMAYLEARIEELTNELATLRGE